MLNLRSNASCDGMRHQRDPLAAAFGLRLSSGQTRCLGDGGVYCEYSPSAGHRRGPAGCRAQGKSLLRCLLTLTDVNMLKLVLRVNEGRRCVCLIC